MPKAKKANIEAAPRPRTRLDLGSVALIGVFLVSAVAVYYPLDVTGYILIGLLGALMAVKHITISKEMDFLISVTAFMVITVAMLPLITGALRDFLTNLVIGFGTAGFFVALGKIIKLGIWR